MTAAEAIPRLAVITTILLATGVWLHWQPNLVLGVLVGLFTVLLWQRTEAKKARFQRTGFTLKDLKRLSPAQFEEWCADRLREQGFTVKVVGGQGDHGIDLIAERDAVRTAVQCKRWFGVRSVGEPQIRDLFGAMQHEGAASGMVLTTGQFSPAAVTWAHGKSIKLWGPEELLAGSPPAALKVTMLTAPSTQACPSCGGDLVRRVNRSTQMPFWGCSGYPTCRFTRPM
ncbi:MAG TPA: restriction endonuclease [Patescibacteria group bacterium]|jgi:restriction system protein|nr:restriction endonuclease [Patescibacteria group bacterium]